MLLPQNARFFSNLLDYIVHRTIGHCVRLVQYRQAAAPIVIRRPLTYSNPLVTRQRLTLTANKVIDWRNDQDSWPTAIICATPEGDTASQSDANAVLASIAMMARLYYLIATY